jgi:hypothetical protein
MRAPKSNSGSNFEIPEGSHTGVCVMVIDCGVWDREFQGNHKSVRELYLRWELPDVTIDSGEYAGKRACIGRRYTFSMFKKANLRRDLETWRGKPFTDLEADTFEIDNVAGAACTLQVFRNEAGYDNIQFIMPYRGPKIDSENQVLVFDCENPTGFHSLPEWVQKKINLPDDEAAREYADVASSERLEDKPF